MKIKTILFLILYPAIIYSQVSDNAKLTLDSCIQIAMQNHRDLRVIEEEDVISYADYRISNAQRLPSLSLGITTKEIKDEGLDSGELPIPGKDSKYGVVAGLTFTYDIYKPGRSESIRISQKNMEKNAIENNVKKNGIKLSVKKAYYNYILAYESNRLMDLSFKRYSRILRKITIESQAGLVGPVQMSDWQIKMSSVELDYEDSVQNLESARTDLFLAMGLEVDNKTSIEVALLDSVPELIINENQLVRYAQDHSPSIKMANIATEVARNSYLISRSKRYPSITLFSTLGYENSEFLNSEMGVVERTTDTDNWSPSWTGGVRASMPIYTGGSLPASIDKAESGYKKTQYSKTSTELDVKMSVKKLFSRLVFLKKQIKISKAGVINAQTNLRINERSYESGLVGQDAISDASENLYAAEISLLKNKIDFMISLTELSNIVGIHEELICR
ncbi:MAG: TolC family protein [Spirochaetes bacterium]|nr:TolC family protein [Spirochaetota bacterium]MBN2771718.1 TolC family protein [Spirochaetota bacterium]